MLPVFYKTDLESDEIMLNEEESKHCVRVLRLAEGDKVLLANGNGMRAEATIQQAHPKHCALWINHREQMSKTFPYKLTIGITPTKNMERIEWFIEKAVECGIDEIHFIETNRSERTRINLDRCHKIAISAMKQSKQWHLPHIHPLQSFDGFIKHQHDATKLIAWCEADDAAFIGKISKTADVCILIGPEGDFAKQEVDNAIVNGFTPISLGKSILRTETAALFACMSIKTLMS